MRVDPAQQESVPVKSEQLNPEQQERIRRRAHQIYEEQGREGRRTRPKSLAASESRSRE
jgi:hypothetical protein